MSAWSGEFKGSTSFALRTDVPQWGRGGAGLVDALLDVIAHLDGVSVYDPDEVLCLTSVGFKQYVYEPAYNPDYDPPRRVSDKARLFSNFGIVESFGQHTGHELLELNFIGAGDLAKLLAFEFASDRVVLTWTSIDGVSAPQWCAITAVDADPARFMVELMGRDGERHSVDVSARGGSLQGEDEDLVNWCVVVRPGEKAPWALTLVARRALVCRWGIKHARATKEFFHETRENYAPGLSGYESLARTLRRGGLSASEQEVVWRHIEELARGRAALARRLPVWGEESEHHKPLLYEEAARGYDVASKHLHAATECDALDEACIALLDLAATAEKEAIEVLSRMTWVMP